MGKSMGNHECDWIVARLPLWVDNGDSNGSIEVHGERGDLTVEERQEIDQHLAGCARCSRHRVALEQALGALAIAANHLPVVSGAASLWPLLEQRIANHKTPSCWRWRLSPRSSTARSVRRWENLDSTRPLRQAWTRDTLRELLAGRNQQKTGSKRFSGLLLKTSMAAAVLLALTAISLAHWQWTHAQSTILANTIPLAEPIAAPTITEEPPLEIADRDRVEVPANELPDADPPRPPETAPITVEVPAPKPSSRTRFGFDLEHGIPMPPDTREAKPVY
jgi:anti-sigma factor RsiW